MMRAFSTLHWPAVLVATLAYFFVGVPVFSAFGDVWQAAGFVKPEGWQPGAQYYVGPLLADLVVVVCTAALAKALGATTAREGAGVGLVVALGYLAPTVGIDSMSPAHPEPMKIFLITATYHLVGLVLAAVIVTVWVKKRAAAAAV